MTLTSPEYWTSYANCNIADPNAFFIKLTPQTSRQEKIRLETAMKLCETCPVIEQCSDIGSKNYLVGVFGGVYRRPKM